MKAKLLLLTFPFLLASCGGGSSTNKITFTGEKTVQLSSADENSVVMPFTLEKSLNSGEYLTGPTFTAYSGNVMTESSCPISEVVNNAFTVTLKFVKSTIGKSAQVTANIKVAVMDKNGLEITSTVVSGYSITWNLKE